MPLISTLIHHIIQFKKHFLRISVIQSKQCAIVATLSVIVSDQEVVFEYKPQEYCDS